MKGKHKLDQSGSFSLLKLTITVAISIGVRVILSFSGFHKSLARRVELTSPVSSWFRGIVLNVLYVSINYFNNSIGLCKFCIQNFIYIIYSRIW